MNIYFNFHEGEFYYDNFGNLGLNAYPNGTLKQSVSTISSGQPMKLANIDDIVDYIPKMRGVPKAQSAWVQIFNSGYRISAVSKSNFYDSDFNDKWKYWNGVVFVDMDCNHYKGKDSDKVMDNMDKIIEWSAYNMSQPNAYLCENNFLMAQKSASGNAHYFFYYDCERTYENFLKCVKKATECVKKQFKILCNKDIVEDLLNWPGVVDPCNERPAQPIYFSQNPIVFNPNYKNLSGEVNLPHLDIEIEDNFENDVKDISFSNDYSKIKMRDNIKWFGIDDWSYTESRFALLKVFCRQFGDDEQAALSLLDEFAPLIAGKGNNHNPYEIRRLFKINYRSLNRIIQNELRKPIIQQNSHYTNLSERMLNFCKYNFNFSFKYDTKLDLNKKIFDNKENDYVVKLDKKQMLSDVLEDIINKSPKNIIHIEAGCGVGKTYSAKKLSGFDVEDDSISQFDVLFDIFSNQSNKRICFITPLTSINSDNFENVNKWKIIDGKHSGNKKYLKDNNQNICITWDSFIIHKLYSENYYFDYYFFDESHMFYLQDYRTETIAKLKNIIKNELSKKKDSKTVMFTGTPSYETKEFDCYKVKVEKELTHVKCNFVFYNNSYKGWIINDCKEWCKQDKKNRFAIFFDKANYDMYKKLEDWGLDMSCCYNKQMDDDVRFVTKKHDQKGNGGIYSALANAGINLYTKHPIKIYIISNNAMSIIQYANRFRNREMIESINIFQKKSDIHNNVNRNTYDNIAVIQKNVDRLNEQYHNSKFIDNNKLGWLIYNKFGLNDQYLDNEDDKKVLNPEKYDTFMHIKIEDDYESQSQIIRKRLVQNYFDINPIYLEIDNVLDNSKYYGCFSSIIQEFNNKFYNCCEADVSQFDELFKWNTKSESFYLDMKKCKDLKKGLVADMQSNIETIFTNLFKDNTDDDKDSEHKKTIEERKTETIKYWINFCNNCLKRNDTISKVDLKRFVKILNIKKHFNNFKDNYILYYIYKTKEDHNLEVEDYMKLAAFYTTISKVNKEDFFDCCRFADDTYNKLKELSTIIENFSWFVEWDKLKNCSENLEDEIKKYDKDFNQRIFNHLAKKHVRGKEEKNMKKVLYDGQIYNSEKELADKLGKNKLTIIRWIKEGKAQFITE